MRSRRGKVVGYIMCRIEYGLSMTKRFGLAKKGHIISIAVLEEKEARGSARRSSRRRWRRSERPRARSATSRSGRRTRGAIALYEKLGFKVSSTLHGYYKDGESAYTMATPL